jgi:hypothetical protein
MYFPYLRGKQYELIALRNLADLMSRNRHKVSPVIEPVKKATQPLARCLRELADRNINFNIVLNPSVGELSKGEGKDIILDCLRETLHDYDNYQLAFLINSESSWEEVYQTLYDIDIFHKGITLIHNTQFIDIRERIDSFPGVLFNIVNNKTSRRYHRSFVDKSKVSFEDYFVSKNRNSDYAAVIDEMFSDEYKYYRDENFVGFCDYLTLGAGYADGGFMPTAVAFHITYKSKDGAIRIHHFVSDTNNESADVAAKFAEALYKMMNWLSDVYHNTAAVEEFKELHLKRHFPGLGTIKRLSIENHIELIIKLI